jgi:hypothetical protein
VSVRSACSRTPASTRHIIPCIRYIVQTGIFRISESYRNYTAIPPCRYTVAYRYVPALLLRLEAYVGVDFLEQSKQLSSAHAGIMCSHCIDSIHIYAKTTDCNFPFFLCISIFPNRLPEMCLGTSGHGTSRRVNGQVEGTRTPCQGSKCAKMGTTQSGKHMGIRGGSGR